MINYGTIITKIGLERITNAQTTQSQINLSHIALGDANGTPYTPSDTQTQLVNEVWRGPIANLKTDANRITTDALLQPTDGGFTIREIGLFDVDNNLIAIGNYPEKYKPILTDGVSDEVLIQVVIDVENADVINLVIDPTVVTATRKYVDDKTDEVSTDLVDLRQKVTANEQTVTEHLEKTVTKTTSNLTYFINASSGNDNNNGLSNVTAFKTIQKALSILPQRINHVVNINLAPGTYAEDVVITTYDGNGQLRIVGGTSNLNADSFAINSINILNTNLDIRINYISVISTIKNTFIINNCSKVLVTGVVAITTSSFNGFTATNSTVNIGSSVVSNKGKAIVSSASVVVSDVNTGADNLVALYAEYGGTIAKAGSQPSGITAETTIYGGVIR